MSIKHVTSTVVLFTLLLISVPGFAQNFYFEASVTGQSFDGPQSTYSTDNITYPAFGIGYRFVTNHSLGFTFSSFSASSTLPRGPGDESGTNLYVKGYPIGLEHRYKIITQSFLTGYLKSSLLLIPLRDGVRTDTPTEYQYTVNPGANLGLGLDGKLTDKLGFFTAVNYRFVRYSSERYPLTIEMEGVHAQIGVKVNF